jgi:predicted RNase H-like HicB family nuclease
MKLKFVAVYTELATNYCAYLPGLPGCVSTGTTWNEIQDMIQEAAEFHIEGMMENGDPLPSERMSAEEAMLHHCEPLTEQEIEEYSQYGECPTVLSVTFKEIEVEVPIPAPVATG